MLEEDRKAMTNALYANGMIGGEDLKRELDSINAMHRQARLRILGEAADLGEDEEFDETPELLAKVGLIDGAQLSD